MAGRLDFYFFYGSIHSYLSVMRIGALASAAGVAVRWQPFNLREILIEQNNTAFTKNDVKMNYFWHDVERRARRHNIPFAGRASRPVGQCDPNPQKRQQFGCRRAGSQHLAIRIVRTQSR